ncbi:MAG: DUF3995 domain-containing protein [Rhizobiaceae bacterium]
MNLIAFLIFILLTVIALLHAYWAFGGRWPGHDEESLVKAVVGSRGVKIMPPFWLTMIVVPLIFAAGYFPLVWVGLAPSFLSATLNWLAMIVLMAVFLGRGIFSYTSLATRMEFEEPFATLDKKYYAPLCLLIGFGLVVLFFSA